MTDVWTMLGNMGLAPLAYFGAFLVGLGIYKFVKDWLPW